ncbi:MAG: polysaccharide deacetylase family protein [Clostridiales bacterium]|nr:polysaccharide deacetylase family protein [Clostridiales bacterium]
MSRYLIINADDFGMCKSANDAIFDLFETGSVFSSTIMIPCPAADDAVKFAVDHPEYAIGVHLTLTNEWEERWPWGSLTGGKSIENGEGRMWPENEDFEAHCTYDEAIAEVYAQIEKAEKAGMKVVQVDNHMGSLYGMNGRYLMLPKIFKVCKNKGYPFRMCTTPVREYCPEGVDYKLYSLFCHISKVISKLYKVPTPDYLILTDQVACLKHTESYEQFRDAFLEFHSHIREGITETFIHPALDTEELRNITGTWQRRYWEYLLMKDPYTHEFFKNKGIELISYRELIKMKK